MKLRKNETTRYLKWRLFISIAIGVIGLSSFAFLFSKIKNSEQSGGTSHVLRKSYLWNEEVWSILRSSKRLSVKKEKPPQNKEPRVNGSLGLKSEFKLKDYLIHIESGSKKLNLPVSAFRIIQKVDYSTDFRCIEGWSEVIHYSGVKFSDFMRDYQLGKKSDGTYFSYVGLETPDGEYYVSLDMESMLHDQTVLAYEMNGKPLSYENGAPLRLIIPIKYGIKSLKRIGRIFFSDTRPPDYWAERGYDWYSGL
jgi:DMSO/TMAO reductase YedYZ molybdopterin-dependent catalytic subunit